MVVLPEVTVSGTATMIDAIARAVTAREEKPVVVRSRKREELVLETRAGLSAGATALASQLSDAYRGAEVSPHFLRLIMPSAMPSALR